MAFETPDLQPDVFAKYGIAPPELASPAAKAPPITAPALKTEKAEAEPEPDVFAKYGIKPPDPGYMGEIARGVKSGFKVQMPEMVGKAAKFFGADKLGDKLADVAKQNDTPDIQESAVGRANDSPYSVRGNVYEAATNAVPSLAPGAAGAAVGAGVGSVVPGVGTGLGALLGYAAGSILSLPVFYGSQAQESYEAVKKQQLKLGKPEAEADAIARRTGHTEGAIEAGGEIAADFIPVAKLFKPFVKPVAKAAGTLIKDTLFPTLKQAAKNVAGIVTGEVGTEMVQQAGEDQVRQSMGDTGPGATWDETSKVIMPTALMSLIPGAGGAAASHIKRRAAITTLADAEADPEARAKIAVGLAAAIEPVDQNLARAFSQYATEKIQAGQPIEIGDDQMYLNKPAEPQAPLLLEHHPGEPLINFPDGTTMTAGEARQRGLYKSVPNGPMAQAAETARAAGASAQGFFPYSEEGATKRALFMTNQGQPHRVAPHHSREGRFMAIPDRLSGTVDEDRIKALEHEGQLLIDHSGPDARVLLPQVRTRLADIDAEIETIKGDLTARAEKKKKTEEVAAKRKADEEALAAETEKKKQAETDRLANESKLAAALHDAEVSDTVAQKSGELDALEQPNAMQLALRTAMKKKGVAKVPTVDEAAHAAASSPKNDLTPPTGPQIEANNAKLGHIKVGPLNISVEHPAGSVREDKKNVPPKWRTEMTDHYGYYKGVPARAPDKEHVDAFTKKGTAADHVGPVFVIDQNHPDGKFDEPKVMNGYASRDDAVKAYLRNYQKGWSKNVRGVTELSSDEMKRRLNTPDAFLKPQPESTQLTKDETASGDADHQPAPAESAKTVTAYDRRTEAQKIAREIEHNFKTAQKVVPHPTEAGKFAVVDELADPRLAEQDLRTELTGMAKEAGWAQEGGKMLRNASSGEITRTTWIPNAAWWPGRPNKLGAKEVQEAVRKALAGERLSIPEKRMVQYMLDNAQRTIAGAEVNSAEVEESGYNDLTDAERAEIDALLAHAEESLGADAVEALRDRVAIASEGLGEQAYADALKESINGAIERISGEPGASQAAEIPAGGESRADSRRDSQAAGETPVEEKPAAETVTAAPAATETPAKVGVSTSELTAAQIPADITITLPVKVEDSGEVHDVDFNAREAFKESSRKLKRLQALRACLG